MPAVPVSRSRMSTDAGAAARSVRLAAARSAIRSTSSRDRFDQRRGRGAAEPARRRHDRRRRRADAAAAGSDGTGTRRPARASMSRWSCRDRRAAAPFLTLAGGVAVAEAFARRRVCRSRSSGRTMSYVDAGGRRRGGASWPAFWPRRRRRRRAAARHPRLRHQPAVRRRIRRSLPIARRRSKPSSGGPVDRAGARRGAGGAGRRARSRSRAGDAAAVLLTRWRALAPSARGTAVEWDTPAGRGRAVSAGHCGRRCAARQDRRTASSGSSPGSCGGHERCGASARAGRDDAFGH